MCETGTSSEIPSQGIFHVRIKNKFTVFMMNIDMEEEYFATFIFQIKS